ncbi:purine-cytosine permease family protein [Kineococcus rhizosphaerae]|uniref:NCS1 family nucleobase:cation symporter-1 n=1 Tax=Kineococcus rhizosphaerae TaxID=559628 RepID=A0A2T0R236_9ACTN|nr:cytosine permease [Kineococcus rhizosphaerae]PRY13622.1 NCS1 family nucleobase:cation symporter-1 [Kineococcus rhizosphaerae]
METDLPAHAPGTRSSGVEARTIEHIPETERHGKTRNLFTIWFGANIMLLTMASGAIATAVYGLPLWAGILAVVVGNVVGGVVMALHAAQGPQMGIPQMLQTRAQFGSFGSLLVIVIVVLMYTAFFASNLVLGGQALAGLVHLPTTAGVLVIGVVSVVAAIVGYRLLHALGTIMSVLAGAAFVVLVVWWIAVDPLPSSVVTNGSFSWVGFMATVSIAALWQIAYAPYVSDYSRYMPKDTGVRPAFWATYWGCVLGSVFGMVVGAVTGAALPDASIPDALHQTAPGISSLLVAVFAIGLSVSNGANVYCGSLATITIGQTLFDDWRPGPRARSVATLAIFAVALVLALATADDFLVNFSNFMILLMCVLIPWTAVNLVDYYLLRHGDYHLPSLFERDGGVYGRANPVAIACYVVGIVVQLPFLVTAFFTGPVANALGGVDVSWIVGLVVICPLYYVLARGRTARTPNPVHGSTGTIAETHPETTPALD